MFQRTPNAARSRFPHFLSANLSLSSLLLSNRGVGFNGHGKLSFETGGVMGFVGADSRPFTQGAAMIAEKKGRPRKVPPGAFRREDAAEFCSMGLSTFDKADVTELVPAARKVGGLKLWSRRELARWIEHGCPPRVEWAAIWSSMVKKHTVN